jgi:hypothetical protein
MLVALWMFVEQEEIKVNIIQLCYEEGLKYFQSIGLSTS